MKEKFLHINLTIQALTESFSYEISLYPRRPRLGWAYHFQIIILFIR